NTAFGSNTKLATVTIPDSVTSIGVNAFYYCISLTNVVLGTNVTIINNFAFSYTKLRNMIIPDRVATIGYAAFQYCTNLSSCIIGTRVGTIGAKAFQDCAALGGVTIPGSVTNI